MAYVNDNRSSERREYSRSYSFIERTPYVSGNAAPAPDYHFPFPKIKELEFKRFSNTDISKKTDALPANSSLAFRTAIYVIAMIFLVGVINITFNGATQSLAQEADALQTSIENARESGKASEVQLGALSNPTIIKEKAEKMGMKAAVNPITINLNDDIVVVDANGNISLADSLVAASNN